MSCGCGCGGAGGCGHTVGALNPMVTRALASRGAIVHRASAQVLPGGLDVSRLTSAQVKAIYRRRQFGGLGTLGISAEGSMLVSKGAGLAAGAGAGTLIGTGAGTAGGVLFGASAGSVVPIVGTVVGAVVGLLVGKLFGAGACYSCILAQVGDAMKVAELYKTMAGQYAGRDIKLQDLNIVWHGLLCEQVFPKNSQKGIGPNVNCKTVTIQQCIQHQVNCSKCCGVASWITDLFNAGAARGFPALIAKANKAGHFNPVTIADQYIIPAWTGPGSQYVTWAAPSNSINPTLVRQLIIDTVDALESLKNPNLPRYYGAGSSNIAATSAATPTSAAVGSAAISATPVTGIQAQAVTAAQQTQQTVSPNGTIVAANSGGTLSTAQGTWSFSASGDGAGNFAVLLNGTATGQYASQLGILNGQPVALMADGSTWGWNGSAWSQLTAASALAAGTAGAPLSSYASSAAGVPVSAASSGTVSAPAGVTGAITAGTSTGASPVVLLGMAGLIGAWFLMKNPSILKKLRH